MGQPSDTSQGARLCSWEKKGGIRGINLCLEKGNKDKKVDIATSHNYFSKCIGHSILHVSAASGVDHGIIHHGYKRLFTTVV